METQIADNSKWEIKGTTYFSEAEAFAREGWEPYAVIALGNVVIYYFRRHPFIFTKHNL